MADIDARHILRLLEARHPLPEWAFFRELRNSTGFPSEERRFDAVAMNCYPSKQFRVIAYEVKVARSDWLKEASDPDKRQFAMLVSNETWFAAPAGVIKEAEVPEGWGLLTASEKQCRRVVQAPYRESVELPAGFVASCLRRAVELVRDANAQRPIYRLDGADVDEATAREYAETIFEDRVDAIRREATWKAKEQARKERQPADDLVSEIRRTMNKPYGTVPTLKEFQEWLTEQRQPIPPPQLQMLEHARDNIGRLLQATVV